MRAALASLAATALRSAQAMEEPANRWIVLASRPRGMPTLDNLRLETTPVPEPSLGQVLLRTVYLSLDP